MPRYLWLLLGLLACQPPAEDPALQRIAQAEAQLEHATADQAQRKALLDLYDAYLARQPAAEASLWQRKADLERQIGNVPAALSALDSANAKAQAPSELSAQLALQAQLFGEALRNPATARLYQAAAVEAAPDSPSARALADSLGPFPGLAQQLAQLANSAQDPSQRADIERYVRGSELYALVHPDAPDLPDRLLAAYQAAAGAGFHERAYALCARSYAWQKGQHPSAPTALFNMAFIQEEHLQNPKKAKALYEEFLARYPQHEMAAIARFALEHLGQDADALLDELKH